MEVQHSILGECSATAVQCLKVARLQSEFRTKDFFFRATNFRTKNALKFSPKLLSLYSVGKKKSHKIPAKFPCEKYKNFTDELLQDRENNAWKTP